MAFPVSVCKSGYPLKPLCFYQPKPEQLAHYFIYGCYLLSLLLFYSVLPFLSLLSNIMHIAWYILCLCHSFEIRGSVMLFKSNNCTVSCLYLLLTSSCMTHSNNVCRHFGSIYTRCILSFQIYIGTS